MASFQNRQQLSNPVSHQRTPPVPLQTIDLITTQSSVSGLGATSHASISEHPTEARHQQLSNGGNADDSQSSAQNAVFKGCMKVCGCFCVFFITLGMASTFGSYQAYYESDLLRSYSPSSISWIGVFFVFLGYWVPLFCIIPFASGSLHTSSTYATYLLSIQNVGSFFGRILPAYIGQLVGSAVVLFAGAISLSVVVFTWLAVSNVAGVTAWCVLVGFCSGIVVSIPNAVASRLSTPSNVGLRIGFMWTVGAFAELIGSPIAGVLVNQQHGDGQDVSYIGAQIFGGASIAIGATFLVVPAWSIFKHDRLKDA